MLILCVLRKGREYGPEHVERLRLSLRKHSDARLVCLSDVPVTCERVELQHDWPGWWSKLELFAYDWKEPVLYVDLDTTFIDDPAPLLRATPGITMLARLNRPGDVGSGVMSWSGDYSHIYRAFRSDPLGIPARYNTTPSWGDQGFIRDQIGVRNIDVFPQTLAASYKGHCTGMLRHEYRCPHEDVRVVYFHGKPRPWEVPPVWK